MKEDFINVANTEEERAVLESMYEPGMRPRDAEAFLELLHGCERHDLAHFLRSDTGILARVTPDEHEYLKTLPDNKTNGYYARRLLEYREDTPGNPDQISINMAKKGN